MNSGTVLTQRLRQVQLSYIEQDVQRLGRFQAFQCRVEKRLANSPRQFVMFRFVLRKSRSEVQLEFFDLSPIRDRFRDM